MLSHRLQLPHQHIVGLLRGCIKLLRIPVDERERPLQCRFQLFIVFILRLHHEQTLREGLRLVIQRVRLFVEIGNIRLFHLMVKSTILSNVDFKSGPEKQCQSNLFFRQPAKNHFPVVSVRPLVTFAVHIQKAFHPLSAFPRLLEVKEPDDLTAFLCLRKLHCLIQPEVPIPTVQHIMEPERIPLDLLRQFTVYLVFWKFPGHPGKGRDALMPEVPSLS